MLRKLLLIIGVVSAVLFIAPTASNAAYSPLTVSDTSVATGGSVTISGSGYAPNTTISVYVHSDPVFLGTTTTDSTGAFSASFTLPSDLGSGSHTLQASGLDTNGNIKVLAETVTVGSTSSTSTLATTGAYVGVTALLALVLLAIGGAFMLTSRRLASRRANANS